MKKFFYPPDEVGLEITEKCNLDCIYCYCKERHCNHSKLTMEDWLAIISDLSIWGVATITLAGGEPFLHSKIYNIIRTVVKKKMRLNIDTNGTLIHKINRTFLKYMADSQVRLFFSLDSFVFSEYLYMTGYNSLRSVVDNIKRCIDFGIKCYIVQVLTKINYKSSFEAIKKAKELGCSGINFLKGNIRRSVGKSDINISYEDFEKHYREILKCEDGENFCVSHEYAKKCAPILGEMGISCRGVLFACPYNIDLNMGRWQQGNKLSDIIRNSELYTLFASSEENMIQEYALKHFGECGALAKFSLHKNSGV